MISYKPQVAILHINMAAPNFTGDGQQKTFEDLICSLDLTPRLHAQLTFISVLNSILSVAAFLGNALILIALYKESSLHPPSKLLLRNLATTDLCIGLILEPLTVIGWMYVGNGHRNICPLLSAASLVKGYILFGVSVATLTAISVDSLLALLLKLRYKQVVTLKRTYVIVISIWVVRTVPSAIQFWNPLMTLWCGIMGASLCLVISSFCYTKIFLTLRHHQNKLQDPVQQPNQTNQLNKVRYKKAVSTAIWLELTLVACYLHYCVVAVSRPSSALTWMYAATLVFLNSSLNPILLLEDRRSQTSSEEHNQTSTLPLFCELDLVDQNNRED